MSDETRRILDLLAAGKISADEAEQLLKAAAQETEADAAPAETPGAAGAEPKFLRIEVHKAARDLRPEKNVNIRVPISMVRGGMRLGALIPGTSVRIQDALRDKGLDLDWSKLDRADLAAVLKDVGELTMDVDDGRARVKITAE
jgi:hypothetical protein